MPSPDIQTIELLQLASGDVLSLQVYRFIGKPGKKAYLQANLHGGEIVGNGILQSLIEELTLLPPEQLQGEICIVPLCNPLGLNQRNHFFATGRFNPYDGKDWNRIFWDYSQVWGDIETFARSQIHLPAAQIEANFCLRLQRALEREAEAFATSASVPYYQRYRYILQRLSVDAQYILDLHSSSNRGTDYLFCFSSREKSAPYFLIDYGILMESYEGVSYDEACFKPWLLYEDVLAKLGAPLKFDRETWTLEYGSGMHLSPTSLKRGSAGIRNYLQAKGFFPQAETHIKTTPIRLVGRHNLAKYYAPAGGIIQNRAPLNSYVQAGQRLYQILAFPPGAMPVYQDVCASASGLVYDVSYCESVNQGEYVLAMMYWET
ncbi:MAG: succinylglutamate desuccinylase/aspartoacylase family protein [Cyanobacteria bacterium P01_H01_bin.15]